MRTPDLNHERNLWRARFLARFTRFKNQLIRRWWLLPAGVVMGLSAQMTVWWFEKPVYVSCGQLIVNVKLSIPEGSLYTEELNNFLGTQAALMQSGVVVNRASNRVAERPADAGNEPVALKALILPKTTIFLLQGTGHDPRYTQDFVQACMEEYISLKKEMRAQTSDSTLAGMTEEAIRLEKELRKSEEESVSFQSTNSVILLQEQGNSAGNFLAGLHQRLAALKSEYVLVQTLTLDQSLERQQQSGPASPILSDTPPGSLLVDSAGLADSDYLRARQQVLLLQAEQDDLAHYLRPKHPRMAALSEEIARRERLLEIFRQQSARQLERRKDSLKVQILNLENDVKEWDVRALEISRRSAEFQRLKANSQRKQALYDRLMGTMQTLDVNKQVSPESVTIMENASPAIAQHSALASKFLVGSLAGLGLSVLVLMFLDRLDDRINSFTELQEMFDEEVLGQIPREKSALRKGEPGLLQPEDERYGFVEAYRNLRSTLLYMSAPDQHPKTILVTSSVPNDGKSLTSANLAITLATAGAHVLLVDADLRKGSLHNRFGIAAGCPGLSEALGRELNPQPPSARTEVFSRWSRRNAAKTEVGAAGQGFAMPPSWTQSVQPTKVPNLFLLPRGGATHKSSELFLSALTPRFLEDAAGQYDFVILDTAPVMAADDATTLAPHIDGVVFVVRAEHTSARVAQAAIDVLYLRHVRILGLVLNAVRPTSVDYYYYYKYKDYYDSYPTA